MVTVAIISNVTIVLHVKRDKLHVDPRINAKDSTAHPQGLCMFENRAVASWQQN